jgi:Tol biopolymer transport system component
MPPLKVRKFTSFRGVETNPAFSPDGNQVAFCWNGEKQDNFDIYVQLIDGGKTLRLTTNTAEDREPAWSPDGRRIAFNRYTPEACEILIIPALGGAERKLGMTESADWVDRLIGKMSWSPDEKLLAIAENNPSENASRICLISTETAERQRLTSPSRGVRDSVPIFSPDGKTLAFLRNSFSSTRLFVLSLVDGKANGEPRQLALDRLILIGCRTVVVLCSHRTVQVH